MCDFVCFLLENAVLAVFFKVIIQSYGHVFLEN